VELKEWHTCKQSSLHLPLLLLLNHELDAEDLLLSSAWMVTALVTDSREASKIPTNL
jgi:hypothetical protein